MITKFDPQRIDAICSGFQKARILLSAAELDLFSMFSRWDEEISS